MFPHTERRLSLLFAAALLLVPATQSATAQRVVPGESTAAVADTGEVAFPQEGEIHLGTSCTSNSECAANEFCFVLGFRCLGEGTCQPRPQFCPLLWDPVCGCDGVTYSNECIAHLYGVNIASKGACTPLP